MFWVTEKPPIKNILYGDLVDGLSEQSEDMSAGQEMDFYWQAAMCQELCGVCCAETAENLVPMSS